MAGSPIKRMRKAGLIPANLSLGGARPSKGRATPTKQDLSRARAAELVPTDVDTDDKTTRRAQTLRQLAHVAKIGRETGMLQVAAMAYKALLDEFGPDAVDMAPEELAKLTKDELRAMKREVARKLLEEADGDE